jgi:Spy/CpxP family protein refolding chaperone
MKITLLSFLLVGAALTALPLQTASGDDTTTPGQNPPSSGSPNSDDTAPAPKTHARHSGHRRHLFAQLNLSDAQKTQIKQIKATVTDHKERRHQIMALLTADQRARLKELRAEGKHKA